ncbi:hypothetical protein GCM10007423_03550 [Dyadobacter endophyticus]|uniref:Lipocalin-like domain-containing protein n=1 Tax=Dyadobacter endophyticus TaxID=1749036 RepID=A0ABQ1YER7_9BACT|nr:hypothetical protein [Dyadobacter endophyticus]GGH22011.1 hypothetical protein GCM10007423_03550 [Dyadobacter endophyticus]
MQIAQISIKLSVAFVLIALTGGCNKDEINPQQAILGKWENFYSGNGEYRPPYDKPGGYWNFLTDSVLVEYDLTTNRTNTRKYWIDTLLNIGTPGGSISYYTVKFYADTMELNIENRTAINYVSKWKRVN